MGDQDWKVQYMGRETSGKSEERQEKRAGDSKSSVSSPFLAFPVHKDRNFQIKTYLSSIKLLLLNEDLNIHSNLSRITLP
jgi:hypothetical protein